MSYPSSGLARAAASAVATPPPPPPTARPSSVGSQSTCATNSRDVVRAGMPLPTTHAGTLARRVTSARSFGNGDARPNEPAVGGRKTSPLCGRPSWLGGSAP